MKNANKPVISPFLGVFEEYARMKEPDSRLRLAAFRGFRTFFPVFS